MTRATRLLGLAATLWLGAGVASAGTLVEFPNLPGQEPSRLSGYLARPDTGLSAIVGGQANAGAPYPAVVVLHGCSGISSHSIGIADRLGSLGYVALTVDSLGPRGIATRCSGGGLPGQPFDAYAALRYLSGLEDVDPPRIAVLGQSLGGYAALYAADRDLAAQYVTGRFRAAIAYYPRCYIAIISLTAPALILKGENDEWSPAEACRSMVAHARPDSAPIDLVTYPGVHHAFDVANLKPGMRSTGGWLEYNEAAAKDAEQKVRDFLAANLTRRP